MADEQWPPAPSRDRRERCTKAIRPAREEHDGLGRTFRIPDAEPRLPGPTTMNGLEVEVPIIVGQESQRIGQAGADRFLLPEVGLSHWNHQRQAPAPIVSVNVPGTTPRHLLIG